MLRVQRREREREGRVGGRQVKVCTVNQSQSGMSLIQWREEVDGVSLYDRQVDQ